MANELMATDQAVSISLAQHMATAYAETCQFALRKYGHECTEPGSEELESVPAANIEWRHLSAVGADNPARGAAIWRRLMDAAASERNSPYRAAVAVGADARPMDLARFYVLRSQLAQDWNPRNGIENHLIDTLTQAAWMQEYWSLTQVERLQSDAARDRREFDELRHKEVNYQFGPWIAPRQSDADAQDRAAAEIERWHRMYIRTLRALRDMRRYNVVINNAGQVNVAEKQINIAQMDRTP